MQSITSKLAIIFLSLLASTHTFAFNSEQVCKAMNEAIKSIPTHNLPVYWGPITHIYSRETSALDTKGRVTGHVGGYPLRIEGNYGLECSGETCHVNKKWPDCECTSKKQWNSGLCAADEATARRNAADPKNCQVCGPGCFTLEFMTGDGEKGTEASCPPR